MIDQGTHHVKFSVFSDQHHNSLSPPSFQNNSQTEFFPTNQQKQQHMPSKPIVAPNSLGKQKYGTQASTSIKARFFRNGDKHHQGEVVVLDPRRFNDLDKLRSHLDCVVTLSTGPVLSIKTIGGKKITKLEQLEDGHDYFAVGGEGKINKEQLQVMMMKKTKTSSPREEEEEEEIEPKKPIRRDPVVHGSLGKQKFGTQASTSIKCRFFRNGDKHHKGEEVVLDPRRFNDLEKLKLHLDKVVTLSTGPVLHIKTTGGKKLSKLEQFEDGRTYFAIGGEGKINKDQWPLCLKKPKRKTTTA
mmetsp:Transcript_6943/g.25961  ORF Transcript_6943/g.25961 Transcript_6943/m.25961 type:complete len:300 (-) Transcript_6943:140-1039(-)